MADSELQPAKKEAFLASLAWLQFKQLVCSYRATNFEQFTSTLIQEYKHVHPDFVQLALMSPVIPVSSAPCEQGFSVQNSVKTSLRNRLNPEQLNRMMMVRPVEL